MSSCRVRPIMKRDVGVPPTVCPALTPSRRPRPPSPAPRRPPPCPLRLRAAERTVRKGTILRPASLPVGGAQCVELHIDAGVAPEPAGRGRPVAGGAGVRPVGGRRRTARDRRVVAGLRRPVGCRHPSRPPLQGGVCRVPLVSRIAHYLRRPDGARRVRRRRGCRRRHRRASGAGWGAATTGGLWPRSGARVRGSARGRDRSRRACAEARRRGRGGRRG